MPSWAMSRAATCGVLDRVLRRRRPARQLIGSQARRRCVLSDAMRRRATRRARQFQLAQPYASRCSTRLSIARWPPAAASARARRTWPAGDAGDTAMTLVALVRTAGAQPRRARWHGDRTGAARRLGAARLARLAAQHRSRQPPQHRRPLRSRQRILRACSCQQDLMYSSALLARRRTTRSRPPRRASSTSSAASSSSLPAITCIEIGTGWGGFALHAARHYGCRVTTTTISARAVRCRPATRRRSRPRGSGHGAAARTTAISPAVRQAGLDRDDRGDRRAVPRDLFRAARPAAEARRAGADPGDHHRGSSLRAGAASRWISSSATCFPAASFPRSGRCSPPRRARATWRWSSSRTSATPMRAPWRPGAKRFLAQLPQVRAPGIRRALHPHVGILPGLLRRRLPRTLDRRGAPAAHQARLAPRRHTRRRGDRRVRFWIILCAYQLVWFTAVIGAGRDWLARGGRAALFAAWQLSSSQHPGIELRLIAVALLVGTLLESTWVGCGLIHYSAAWPSANLARMDPGALGGFALTILPLFGYLRARPWLAAALAPSAARSPTSARRAAGTRCGSRPPRGLLSSHSRSAGASPAAPDQPRSALAAPGASGEPAVSQGWRSWCCGSLPRR